MKKVLITMYIVIYLILQYGITLLVGMFMEFASFKNRMNDFSLSDSFLNNAYHPLRNIITFIGDKNPLFILLSVGLIIGMIVLIVKQSLQMKSSELEYDSKGTHGTARWGSLRELVSDGNFKAEKSSKFFKDWTRTLGEDE